MILLRRKRRATRLSIMLWALLISFVCGAIELGEPLEDLYRGGRNLVRARPADGKVVVVGLDDKTFDAMGKIYFSREHDAKVIDNLFAMGAKRVFFDRTYSGLTDEQGDAAFESALRRHPNKVYLGAITSIAGFTGKKSEIVPHPRYRTIASTATLNAHATPFGLSMDIRYADLFGNQSVRSISAEIADITKRPGSQYRPDWSIQASTIPTYSFIDIENGTAKRSQIEGRDVIVGPTADRLHDFARIAGQGWIPGVYFHAVGAQTLREGTPRDLGWLVAWAIAGLFALALLKARDGRRSRAITWGFVTLAIIAPFVFDWAFIKSDFLPAYLLFGIVRFRWKNLSDINLAERTNAGTMLPNLASLHEVEEASQRPVIALRIRNYAAIRASFRDSIGDELVSELARRLDLPGEKTTFYQAEDVLYWLAPRISRQELNSHLEGLARLAEAHLELRGRILDPQVSFGIDDEFDRPVPSRIASALLAADIAGARNQVFRFHESTARADPEWELSLMAELDAAIAAGHIWVAYQPQYRLRSRTIVGVEALVRWQHPLRGAIAPDSFIIAAEAHNRIYKLTMHVLSLALAECKPLLGERHDFRLAVNLSAVLLTYPRIVPELLAVLERHNFPTANLTLEVTETARIASEATASRTLTELGEAGIHISIDDYGTGNATLDYLRTIPCQEIKIDKLFVSQIVTSASDRMLVESTIRLAHQLGRRVVAEGIEDQDTFKLLKELGCDVAQGYFLARPVPIQDLAAIMAYKRKRKAA